LTFGKSANDGDALITTTSPRTNGPFLRLTEPLVEALESISKAQSCKVSVFANLRNITDQRFNSDRHEKSLSPKPTSIANMRITSNIGFSSTISWPILRHPPN